MCRSAYVVFFFASLLLLSVFFLLYIERQTPVLMLKTRNSYYTLGVFFAATLTTIRIPRCIQIAPFWNRSADTSQYDFISA